MFSRVLIWDKFFDTLKFIGGFRGFGRWLARKQIQRQNSQHIFKLSVEKYTEVVWTEQFIQLKNTELQLRCRDPFVAIFGQPFCDGYVRLVILRTAITINYKKAMAR